jgi:phosphoglycolate phosphatase
MTIIFDFDGTLADSLSVMLDIYNREIAPQWNLRPVAPEDWHILRQSSFTKGMRTIGVKPYQLAKILNEGRRLVKSRSGDIKLFPGAAKLIKKLADDGHDLYVLSTNDQAVINDVFKAAGIAECIQVLKSPRLFGKASSLRRLVRQTGVPPGDAWMVGDELRDMSAAKRVGLKSLAVTWGFQPEITLAALRPTAIAHKLSDIPDIIAKQ